MGKSAYILGELLQIVSKMGLEISHVYEDLAFISSNAFLALLPPVGEPKQFKLYFNKDCFDRAIGSATELFAQAAERNGCSVQYAGRYKIVQTDEGMLDVMLYNDQEDAPLADTA